MNKNRYSVVVFDLDGTLLDTLEDLTDSVNFALGNNGFPERTIDEVRSFVGNGIVKLVERALPGKVSDETFARCMADFRTFYSANSAIKTKPYEGINEVLSSLIEHGVKTAVVSNKTDDRTRPLCEHYFGSLIGYSVGKKDGVKPKPEPDAVFEAIAAVGGDRESAVYIGDSEVDIQTAANAGIPLIGVAWGFRGREFLEKNGAAVIADSTGELLNLLLNAE